MLDLTKWAQAGALQSYYRSTLTRPSWSRAEMAPLPDILRMPGLLVGSALLLILGSNPVWGNNTTTTSTSSPSTTTGPTTDIAAIVAPIVTLGLLAIIAGVLTWLFCVVKKKRQTEGTYRPSAEEQSGTRSVETPNALKLPKEERLI
ncbi:protein crumbs homolog 3a [Lampris incognitus]|uniref:protein crumbs homolog 3a n=1 Tax=Lampris incognitus TaxID=2546036 RepID=UPI0024B4D9C3|nr:protein crumbs homolog 3a [Lampris incognitus]XP_056144019.1 protein crumbs homolog 3a [Lampris incognitus]